MSRIRYEISGWNDMMRDLARVQRAPERARPLLEAALARASASAQSLVHVHTGRTKASHRRESSWDSLEKEWTGSLSWESEGVGWEVDRGGDHSAFFDQLYLFNDQFEDAVRQALLGSDD